MIYATPPLDEDDRAVLAKIDDLRDRLRFFLHEPRRWYGSLRRATLARAVQGSNSIEGYHATVEDVVAVIDGEEPLDADAETRRAIEGYRDAMTYVLQLGASGAKPPLDVSLLKALHFMMIKHDLAKNPGQWRPAAVWVANEAGDTVYEPPPREQIDDLINEVLQSANTPSGDAIVSAAMAHLNLTLVHPFSDGNGRMARCIQSYVLAGEATLSPEFLSIEEYLGQHTTGYYDALTEVAQGRWSPERSAYPWIRFCLTAHYRQGLTLLRRVDETEALWDRCELLARAHRLPDRTVGALCDAARGWQLRRPLYVKTVLASAGESISDLTASRDLAAMVKAGLLAASGEKRGRSYRATDELAAAWRSVRPGRGAPVDDDPYPHAT